MRGCRRLTRSSSPATVRGALVETIAGVWEAMVSAPAKASTNKQTTEQTTVLQRRAGAKPEVAIMSSVTTQTLASGGLK
jgi:hypothetical protein